MIVIDTFFVLKTWMRGSDIAVRDRVLKSWLRASDGVVSGNWSLFRQGPKPVQ
jgi:hypothetical protein